MRIQFEVQINQYWHFLICIYISVVRYNPLPFQDYFVLKKMAEDFSLKMLWSYENIQDKEMQQERSIVLTGKDDSV